METTENLTVAGQRARETGVSGRFEVHFLPENTHVLSHTWVWTGAVQGFVFLPGSWTVRPTHQLSASRRRTKHALLQSFQVITLLTG